MRRIVLLAVSYSVARGSEVDDVTFEPAYGYRREQYGSAQHRAEEDEEGDDEDDNDFLEWARILGQSESTEATTSNQHRSAVW